MKKIWYVAKRDFLATVTTKGFIIGILVVPLMITIVVLVFPRMINRASPKIVGEIAVIDPTGQVAAGLRAYLQPKRFVERREESRQRATEEAPAVLKRAAASSPQGQAAMQRQLDAAFGEAPQIDVVALESATDLEQAKAPLKVVPGRKGGDAPRRLALIVVHPDAVRRAEGKDSFGSYDLFVRGKLDDRLVDDIHDGLHDAIVNARVQASGLNRTEIEALTQVHRPQSRTVTEGGEQTTNETLNMTLPAAFMILLLMSTMFSGQYLLTTTVEEKSNRVVEVLLSALSPMS